MVLEISDDKLKISANEIILKVRKKARWKRRELVFEKKRPYSKIVAFCVKNTNSYVFLEIEDENNDYE